MVSRSGKGDDVGAEIEQPFRPWSGVVPINAIIGSSSKNLRGDLTYPHMILTLVADSPIIL